MLSQEQKETFVEWGFVKIEGLIPVEIVDPIREMVMERLNRHGFWGSEGWVAPTDADAVKKLSVTIKEISRSSKSLRPILTDRVLASARDLASGHEVELSPPITQFLFTAPRSYVLNHDGRWNGEWEVPRSIWHLDMPRSATIGAPGPEMFTFVNRVEPEGGGTLILAGSHRLLNDVEYLSSKSVKRKLKRHSYFRELIGKGSDDDRSRFMEDVGYIDDVPVKVVELTGDPGDVYFVDLRLLHSIGANTSGRPRMMIAQRMPRRKAFEAWMSIVMQGAAKEAPGDKSKVSAISKS